MNNDVFQRECVNLVLGDLRKRIGQRITESLVDELHEHLHELIYNSSIGGDEDDEG